MQVTEQDTDVRPGYPKPDGARLFSHARRQCSGDARQRAATDHASETGQRCDGREVRRGEADGPRRPP